MKKGVFSIFFLMCIITPATQAQLAAGQSKFLGNILSAALPDENFATYWNQVTPEDNGKLGYVEPTRGAMNWSVLDAMYGYAQEHGFPFKEHNFVWGMQQPEWINTVSTGEQRTTVRNWIREFGLRYPNTNFIDVVNEPLHRPPHYKNALGGDGTTGWDWVIWAFETTREYCPHAKLLLNEYFELDRNDVDRFIALITLLKDRHLVDGIGVQLHAYEQVSDKVIRSMLDRLATIGLPLYISELDINIADDQAQLNRFKTLFPMLWQHPAVKGVTLWGYKEHHIWQQKAFLLRADGTERPALTWLRAYLHDHNAGPGSHIARRGGNSLTGEK